MSANFDPADNNIAAAVAAGIASAGGTWAFPFPDDVSVVVVPDGLGSTKAIDLIQYIDRPRPGDRREIQVGDIPSFVDYVNAWKGPESLVFLADAHANAIINFGNRAEGLGWSQHNVRVILSHSSEWQRWMAADKKWFRQTEFAEFLEESAGDIVDPDAASLLEIITELEGFKNSTFKTAERLDNGQRVLTYIEDIGVTGSKNGQAAIPTSIRVSLRVYKHDQNVTNLTAGLKYRVNDGKVTFQFVFGQEAEDAIETARETWHRAVRDQINSDPDREPVLIVRA